MTSDLKPQNKLNKLGGLLSEGWELKQKFSNNVSNTKIKKIYDKGMKAGAYGGKLCGAGGGGFILFLADKKAQNKIIDEFGSKNVLPIKFVSRGSEVKSF